ncbi:MAG: lycopene cyclase family protein [Gemmatimonadota bacterium]
MRAIAHPDACDADVVIAGAGAAGLSCAVRLSESGATRRLRVLLLEPRTAYVRDRTWCFWDVIPHPFGAAVSHAWPAWRVATPEGEVERSWPGLAYRHLPADAFYDAALARIEADPNVELRLGVRVLGLETSGEAVIARTDAGPFRARLALDGRPPSPRDEPAAGRDGRHARLLQHFHGEVVRAGEDAFDPAVATVMDFRVSQARGIHFVYVLPFDRRTALVEDTYFAGTPRPVEAYAEEIGAYLATRHRAGRYEVLHSETGAIPMDTRPACLRSGPRTWNVGVRGGAARPSTGYAFLAIQRQAAAIAARLSGWADDPSRAPPVPPRLYSRRAVFLDRVFVSHILRRPEAAPGLFLRMFDRVRPDSLARFLFDGGSPLDDLRVMAALPAAPLVAETVRVCAAR